MTTPRAQAADAMNTAVPGHRTLEAEIARIRREARRRFGGLIREDVNPGSHVREREGRLIDNSVIERAGDVGLIGFSLPVEVGGAGRSKFAWGAVVEELASLSRDPGFPSLIDTTVAITEMILSSGRRELIERYVPELVAGRSFATLATYESRDPYDYESTARLDGDEWVLNGTKPFVTGARFADLGVILLRDEASNDVLAFVVERDDPGVAVLPLQTMGLRTMGLAQVVLHDVRLPQWRLVRRADALSELNAYARGRRTSTASALVGVLESVIESCVESLSTRRRSGRRVLDHPNVERSVGEMRLLLEASRASVYRALDSTREAGRDPYFDELATVAKHHTAECALRIGELVLNLQGGEGYVSAFPWERFMRDVLGMIGGQGSQELLQIQLGQRVIVGLEGARVREEAAQRSVARLADAWWTLHAADALGRDGAGELAGAVREVVSAAGLGAEAPGRRGELAALLDRAHALVTAVRSGHAPDTMPQGPAGLFEGPLADVAAGAWGLLACAVAQETGLLARLQEPCSVKEAAGSLPEDLVRGLLETLVGASLVRRDGDGRYAADPALDPVLGGGPLAAAFAARLRRALAGGARLRTGTPAAGRELVAGCAGEAAALADVLTNSLPGRLEGLPDLLARGGIGCAAGDGGRSAAALAREIPGVPVVALEPEPAAAEQVAADMSVAGAVRVRSDGGPGFEAGDRLALAWLPAAGLTPAELRRAVADAVPALLPGGWLLLPCPLVPKRPLGAAAAHLELALTGGTAWADGEVEDVLRAAGLGPVRAAWEDSALGIRLIAARRP